MFYPVMKLDHTVLCIPQNSMVFSCVKIPIFGLTQQSAYANLIINSQVIMIIIFENLLFNPFLLRRPVCQ
ncbi:hypothetical protein D3C81_1394430 [compost metagenome]